jgi:hypothetical protein
MSEQTTHLFVDLYSKRLFLTVCAVLLLSCADAFLTLTLIAQGKVIEANPFMAYMLSFGVLPFTAVKCSATICGLLVMCLFKNSRITRVSLPLAVVLYLGIIFYEVYIFMM